MKITFIRPNMTPERTGAAVPPLSIAVLESLTPPDVKVDFIDECIEEIPENINCDLAALTVHTFSALRSYRLAKKLKQKGIKVVMGGYHPTFLPEEVLKHCNTVVKGSAELVWKDVVNDAKNNRLKKLYKSDELISIKGVRYSRNLFINKNYGPIVPVEFSRGCKYSCDFCSVSAFNKQKFKARSVKNVIKEIEEIGKKSIYFIDDNLFADEMKAKELLKSLVPLNVKWGCQISLDVAKDKNMMKLLEKSGCIIALLGFESLNIENLKIMKKGANVRFNDYREVVKIFKNHGIMIYGSFVFGYDKDTEKTIELALEFSVNNKFFLANFNTLNPMPGTKLYDRLKIENRLLNNEWWLDDKYKYGEVMFKPDLMSSVQLKNKCMEIRKKFNSFSNIAYRSCDFKANSKDIKNFGMFLMGNLITRKDLIKKMEKVC